MGGGGGKTVVGPTYFTSKATAAPVSHELNIFMGKRISSSSGQKIDQSTVVLLKKACSKYYFFLFFQTELCYDIINSSFLVYRHPLCGLKCPSYVQLALCPGRLPDKEIKHFTKVL